MQVALQMSTGSAMILLCAAVHIFAAALAIGWLRKKRPLMRRSSLRTGFHSVAVLFLIFLVSHTLQLYLWALAFWVSGALHGYEAPIYFALVTDTTLGYGDITLAADFRIFGAMASICGVLMFGLTTAFLVGAFTRLLNTDIT